MASYLLGSTVRLTVTFTVSDVPTDPTTVSLTVGDGTGAPATYTYALAEITRSSAGVYWKEVVPDAAGTWVAVWTGAGDVDAVEEQSFDVVASSHPWATAATPPVYASLTQLHAALRVDGTDELDDVELLRCLQAASRAIDDEVSRRRGKPRRFYTGAVDEVRYYTWDQSLSELAIDDAVAVTAIGLDRSGLRAWDTALEPENYWLVREQGLAGSGPIVRVALDEITPAYAWPTYRSGVQVTGTFGYCATGSPPAAITQACILWAVRLWKRPQAPFAVLESTLDAAPIRVGADADIAGLLAPYCARAWVFV